MSKSHQPRKYPVDPEAWRFVLPVAAVGLVAFFFAWTLLWMFCLLLTLAMLAFFRDPPRRVPRIRGAVLAPADGRITSITTNDDPERGPVGGPCISIFLSVFDVHINRSPFEGTVEQIRYVPGKKLDVRDPEASRVNESNWIYLDCGPYKMTVRQIAGLVARRIVWRVHNGQKLRSGQRIGMIRFGSRTELYLPPQARVQAQLGQTVKGGLSILAFMPHEDQQP